jgi:hypothetical protein
MTEQVLFVDLENVQKVEMYGWPLYSVSSMNPMYARWRKC